MPLHAAGYAEAWHLDALSLVGMSCVQTSRDPSSCLANLAKVNFNQLIQAETFLAVYASV
jgi:hypothetical protein